MCREICGALVCLRLNDTPDAPCSSIIVYQMHTDKLTRDDQRSAYVELPRQEGTLIIGAGALLHCGREGYSPLRYIDNLAALGENPAHCFRSNQHLARKSLVLRNFTPKLCRAGGHGHCRASVGNNV